LEDRQGFETAVRNVIEHVSFDVDTKPQVFEITIRVLGGLLSGHMYASDARSHYKIPWYRGQLLRLAQNLGERLLPAFRTSTGIPYARVRMFIEDWASLIISLIDQSPFRGAKRRINRIMFVFEFCQH
jgi:mannosidase alpha-like ER degradation enhancer 1